MNLTPEDKSKLKRISPLGLELPASKVVIEPFEGDNSPSEEEIVYSKIIATNPLLENLVSDLDLVSSRTGEQIREVKIMYQLRIVETVTATQLLAIAQRIMDKEESYSIKEIITKLMDVLIISQGRALKCFRLMLEAGVIVAIPGKQYCLIGSQYRQWIKD